MTAIFSLSISSCLLEHAIVEMHKKENARNLLMLIYLEWVWEFSGIAAVMKCYDIWTGKANLLPN